MSNGTVRQRHLETLPVDECLQLLAGQYVGRLAYLVDGRPTIRPVNYVLHEGVVVIQTGYGALLDGAASSPAIAFEIDGTDPDYHTGWSVVLHGVAEEIWRPRELESARNLPLRPWVPGDRQHYLRLLPTEISGRRIV
jgi:uncharacterized protein